MRRPSSAGQGLPTSTRDVRHARTREKGPPFRAATVHNQDKRHPAHLLGSPLMDHIRCRPWHAEPVLIDPDRTEPGTRLCLLG
jgi:hypothetical protein